MHQAPPRYVFVYGTLRRGGRNDINALQPAPRYVGMGQVPGRLYHLGWYPGLALGDDEAVLVVGEVYEIEPQLEARLDEIEEVTSGPDSEYFKREVTVKVQDHPLQCLVYEINPERVRGRPQIDHGDWLRFHAS